MLMCNEQYSCVGPIELLCTIIKTLDGILNVLQGKWNIPRQGKFLGYSFTRTNPIRFGISSGYGMEKLKD